VRLRHHTGLSDDEIDATAKRYPSPSLAILELCQKSAVERRLTRVAHKNVKDDVPAAQSADFLYGDDGMPD